MVMCRAAFSRRYETCHTYQPSTPVASIAQRAVIKRSSNVDRLLFDKTNDAAER
jgi:hypothetical protein